MKPNKELISALRNVAHKVSNDQLKWHWSKNESCNCGLLARELGISAEYIRQLQIGTWRILDENYKIGLLDLEMKEVMDILLKKGIEPGDLDYLENEIILGDNSKDLSDFFLELADRLETRLLNKKETKVNSVAVGV